MELALLVERSWEGGSGPPRGKYGKAVPSRRGFAGTTRMCRGAAWGLTRSVGIGSGGGGRDTMSGEVHSSRTVDARLELASRHRPRRDQAQAGANEATITTLVASSYIEEDVLETRRLACYKVKVTNRLQSGQVEIGS